MPTKLNSAGKPQNYIPKGNGEKSGQFTSQSGASGFKSFKKQEETPQSFNAINKMRTGKPSMPKEKTVEAAEKFPETIEEWEQAKLKENSAKPPFNPIKMTVKETPISKVDEKKIQTVLKQYEDMPNAKEAVQKATALRQKYEKSIDIVANDLESLANQNGGVMVGIEFRLKELGSITRKLNSLVTEQKAKGHKWFNLDDAAHMMRDTGRFTMVFDNEDFKQGVEKTFKALQNKGYKFVRADNTFKEGASYKGLNCNFVDKNGTIYEIQFHVPQSLKVKEGYDVDVKNKKAIINKDAITSHDIYETTRVLEDKIKAKTVTPKEKMLYDKLIERSQKAWSDVPNFELNL